MSERRSRDGGGSLYRLCVACGRFISEKRPVFLLGTPSGRIVGPYHAECARKVADAARANGDRHGVPGETCGQLPPRQERDQ